MSVQSHVKVFSRHQDPQHADDAARTIATAMSHDPQTPLWCKDAKHHFDDWWATSLNYQLRMPDRPFIHSIEDEACVAYAYWYPEQKATYDEGEGPTPEGGVDTSPWERPEGMGLLAECLAYLKANKTQFLQERGPFLYLAYMGVRPAQPRRGLGSAMLRHLCDQCDRAGKWAYLEASNEDNARLYKRFGFESLGRDITTELPELVPGVALTLVPMRRAPQRQS